MLSVIIEPTLVLPPDVLLYLRFKKRAVNTKKRKSWSKIRKNTKKFSHRAGLGKESNRSQTQKNVSFIFVNMISKTF